MMALLGGPGPLAPSRGNWKVFPRLPQKILGWSLTRVFILSSGNLPIICGRSIMNQPLLERNHKFFFWCNCGTAYFYESPIHHFWGNTRPDFAHVLGLHAFLARRKWKQNWKTHNLDPEFWEKTATTPGKKKDVLISLQRPMTFFINPCEPNNNPHCFQAEVQYSSFPNPNPGCESFSFVLWQTISLLQ